MSQPAAIYQEVLPTSDRAAFDVWCYGHTLWGLKYFADSGLDIMVVTDIDGKLVRFGGGTMVFGDVQLFDDVRDARGKIEAMKVIW